MATTLKVCFAVVAAVVVGLSLRDDNGAKLFLGALFLISIVWLIAVSGGVGTIIRRKDGTFTNQLDEVEDDDPREQPRQF